MNFARRVFLIAGIYGILVLRAALPHGRKIGRDHPPAITHAEFFYGFTGVALAWQVAFFIIAQDPARYRLMMIPGILEKVSFGIAAIVLYVQERFVPMMLVGGLADLVWAALFAVAFTKLVARSGPCGQHEASITYAPRSSRRHGSPR